MKTAPIILFTYKRITNLQKTVTALQDNFLASESELYIFSDGPKNEQEVELVNEVRAFLPHISGFKRVIINEAEKNIGCANSIIAGVTSVINTYGRAIVLEDDLFITKNFLDYMNAALNQYEFNKEVFSVAGFGFNLGIDPSDSLTDAYLINRSWPWGWATWADRWNPVDWDMKDYPDFKKNRKQRREFAKSGSDLNIMLDRQMEGRSDVWDVRWIYAQYKIKGLTVVPKYSKVFNNGFDKFATHTKGSVKRYVPVLDTTLSQNFNLPKQIQIHPLYQKRFQQKMGVLSRIKSKIETLFIYFFPNNK
jgi:hypothetical protein